MKKLIYGLLLLGACLPAFADTDYYYFLIENNTNESVDMQLYGGLNVNCNRSVVRHIAPNSSEFMPSVQLVGGVSNVGLQLFDADNQAVWQAEVQNMKSSGVFTGVSVTYHANDLSHNIAIQYLGQKPPNGYSRYSKDITTNSLPYKDDWYSAFDNGIEECSTLGSSDACLIFVIDDK